MVELTEICRRTGGGPEPGMLAALMAGMPGRRYLELGAGCAQASITLAHLNTECEIDAVERQAVLVEEAQKLIDHHQVAVQMVRADLRQLTPVLARQAYDGVFFNPPYFEAGKHRPPQDPIRAAARLTLHGDLHDFCLCACEMVKCGGWVVMIHRMEQVEVCAKVLADVGLTLHRQIVLGTGGGKQSLVVLMAQKGGVGPWCRVYDMTIGASKR
ncbi:methyltransferase [Magnetococcus sp. PR-3]|uniref:methyltransferase n=1 Tax=Magnetococcus sp. PR-3 TaxID=3120355 RepID=UPI002FCE25E8